MNNTTHSYHPTSMPGKGLHAFITPDHAEAFTMMQATKLCSALRDVLACKGEILESVEELQGPDTFARVDQAIKAAVAVLAAQPKATQDE